MFLNLIPWSSSPFMCSLGINMFTRFSRVHQTFTCPHRIHIFIRPSSDSYTFTWCWPFIMFEGHAHFCRTIRFSSNFHKLARWQDFCVCWTFMFSNIHVLIKHSHVPTMFMCSPDVLRTLAHSPVTVMLERLHIYIRCSQVSQMVKCSPMFTLAGSSFPSDIHVRWTFTCSPDGHMFNWHSSY